MPTIRLNTVAPDTLDGRNVRASAFEPARVALLNSSRIEEVSAASGVVDRTALVIGGGYSRLPGLLRDRGFTTTAADSSDEATAIAGRCAEGVTHLVAHPARLPVADAAYDLVYCADTLEVLDDIAPVLAEIQRVARPGATIVLDTVAKTFLAKAIYLLAFQRIPFTRIMPPGRYAAARLRDPGDLAATCASVGIDITEIIGFEPASPLALVMSVFDRRAGRINDADLPEAAGFRLSASGHAPVVTYFAVGRRRRVGDNHLDASNRGCSTRRSSGPLSRASRPR